MEDRALLLLESWHGQRRAGQMPLHVTLLSAWRLKRELRIPFNEAVSMARDWAKGRPPLLDLEPDELQNIFIASFLSAKKLAFNCTFILFLLIFAAGSTRSIPLYAAAFAGVLINFALLMWAGLTGKVRRILRIIENSPHSEFLGIVNTALGACPKWLRRRVRPAFSAVLKSCESAEAMAPYKLDSLRLIAQTCPDMVLRRQAEAALTAHHRNQLN